MLATFQVLHKPMWPQATLLVEKRKCPPFQKVLLARVALDFLQLWVRPTF